MLSRISSPSSLRTRSTSTLARGGKHHLKKKILDYITFPFARRLAILSILQIKKKKNEIELLVLSILDQNRISEKEEHFFGAFDSEVESSYAPNFAICRNFIPCSRSCQHFFEGTKRKFVMFLPKSTIQHLRSGQTFEGSSLILSFSSSLSSLSLHKV